MSTIIGRMADERTGKKQLSEERNGTIREI
jgi:hypothetical protein